MAKRRLARAGSKVGRKQVLHAARRHYLHGENLTTIAKELGVSSSYLGRLLKMARENGWVQIFVDADREAELAARIQERWPHLVHVDVVASGGTPEATARNVGTALASWFNDLLNEDEDSGAYAINNVAIGGGMAHRMMVEQVMPRQNRISVGPTALTPSRGRCDRFTAPMVATLLALRLGALTPGDRLPPPAERKGYFYNLSVDPPTDDLDALRNFFDKLKTGAEYLEVLDFWKRVDVVFVSVVEKEFVYNDVAARLERLGIDEDSVDRGVAMFANRLVDSSGLIVPLSDRVLSLEPIMPIEQGDSQVVVLDAWGEPGGAGRCILENGFADVLVTDTTAAIEMLR